ncbi:MAG: carboxypeptidase-like regulatory domain-containing protein [Gemmatimonadaceae bacterium]
MRFAIRLTTMLALIFPCAARAQTSVIIGAVEDSAGAAIANARVNVLGTNVEVLSDTKGRFVIGALRAATYVLQIRRLGYAAVSTLTTVATVDTVRLAIELQPVSTTLATVNVEEKRSPVMLERVGFVRRRISGAAPASRFMTRYEFGRDRLKVAEILRRMGGFSARCNSANVNVLIDGMKIMLPRSGKTDMDFPGAFDSDPLDIIPPNLVEAIEAYDRNTEIPPEFAWAGSCVVLIWTRPG